MEPESIALIMEALKFGAAGIAAGALNQNGIELWDGFKTAIQRKFAGQPKAQIVFAEYEDDPNVWVEPLKKMLKAAKADQDEEIMALAEKLKALEEAQQAATGSRSMIISGHGAGATDGGAAATSGGVAVGGDVEGGINMGGKA